MKNFFAITREAFAILISIACICINPLRAQVPSNFSTWNWEEPKFDQNRTVRQAYINTWTANLPAGNTTNAQLIEAPWAIPNSTAGQLINQKEDYRKANGWELVRFDFGAFNRTAIPYFMLYHKPTGVLRIFAYLSNSNYPNRILFTISHSSNDASFSGHSTGSLSNSSPLLKASDKYLANPAPDEMLSYFSFWGGGPGWAMGQFTLLLDPNSYDSSFVLNSYIIQIFGVQSSNVTLSGSFQYQTQNKDFAFSASPSNVQKDANTGALTVLTKGQKFLGGISTVGEKLDALNKDAVAFRDLISKEQNYNGPYKQIFNIANTVADISANKKLKALTSAAGALGSVFSLAGSLIGLLDDDTGAPAFVPTFSKGTISLDGTITTTSPLSTFLLYTPGTSHSKSGPTSQNIYQQLPYYNCPLGIFNIQTTPSLRKVDYIRAGAYHFNSGASDDDILKNGGYISNQVDGLSCSSYYLRGDIKPIINAQSGLEIVSVKFAIGQKYPLNVLAQPYVDTQYNVYTGSNSYNRIRRYSFMYKQVASGELEVYPYDTGDGTAAGATVIIQTPFMEAACMGSATTIPFNNAFSYNQVPTDNPVFVRVVAELQPIGQPNATHTYFSQDYIPDIVDVSSQYQYPGYVARADEIAPYPIYSYYPAPANAYQSNVSKSGNFIYDNNTTGEVASSALLFTQNSSVEVRVATSTPALFHASTSIGIEGELVVPSGKELAISTDFKSVYPNPYAYYCDPQVNPTGNYAVSNPQCGYDQNALRPANNPTLTVQDAEATDKITVSPNPATGSTMVRFTPVNSECIQQTELINSVGQVSWRKNYACVRTSNIEIPLEGLRTGLYLVRITTSLGIRNTKVLVQ